MIEITYVLIFCAICTLTGFALLFIDTRTEDVDSDYIDWDDPEICSVCGEKCDNYSHWTQGG